MPVKVQDMFVKVCTVFLFVVLSGCFDRPELMTNRPVILAQVDGTIIKLSDFQKRYNRIRATYDPVSLKINKQLESVKKSLLNQMITGVILKTEAVKQNCKVSEEELEKHIAAIREDFSGGEFRQMIIRKNISYSEWKSEHRDYLLIRKLTEKIAGDIPDVTEIQIKDYYKKNIDSFRFKEQVRIQQIVVLTDSAARDILEQLRRGARFEDLAKQYSLSPDGKDGGDIGYFEEGKKIPGFDIAFNLSVGKISKVIKSPYGYHVLKVIGKKKAFVKPLGEARGSIRSILIKEAQDGAYKRWLEKKISEAEIYRNDKILGMI